MLRLVGGGDVRLAQLHEMMERQVHHLVRLVDDLLEMSRVTSGTFSLRSERVDVAEVVRSAVETSEPLIAAAGHRLTLALPGEPLPLVGDPVRLAQVLANLLNNAARYTADGGSITIAARRDGETAEIRVIDDGPGITSEVMPRIFQMFGRGELVGGRGPGGLGIGLALARRLAEMHGGTLTAHSEGRGRGSEFTLRVPLATTLPEEPAEPLPVDAVIAGKRMLVVDDNEDAADTLGVLLEVLGAEVRVVHDGPAALAAFAADEPDVVLLDIGMPGMSGYEVARTIRQRFAGCRAILVALTGWGQDRDRTHAREAGFDHHMVKPADIDALRRLLAKPESARAR